MNGFRISHVVVFGLSFAVGYNSASNAEISNGPQEGLIGGLISRFQDPDGPIRLAAGMALAEIGEPARGALVHASQHEAVRVRLWARCALFLGDLARGDEIFSAFDVFLQDENHRIRIDGCFAIGFMGSKAREYAHLVVPTLTRMQQDPIQNVRIWSNFALYQLDVSKREAAIRNILSFFRSEDWVLQVNAVFAVSQLSPDMDDTLLKVVSPEVVETLNDNDKTVRLWGHFAVSRVDPSRRKNTVSFMLECLTDREQIIRRYAAEALGYIADPDTVTPLVNTLNDIDAKVRGNAAIALQKIGTPEASRALKAKR